MMLLLGNALKSLGIRLLIPPNTTLGVIGLGNMYKLDIIPKSKFLQFMSSGDGRRQ